MSIQTVTGSMTMRTRTIGFAILFALSSGAVLAADFSFTRRVCCNEEQVLPLAEKLACVAQYENEFEQACSDMLENGGLGDLPVSLAKPLDYEDELAKVGNSSQICHTRVKIKPTCQVPNQASRYQYEPSISVG